MAAEKMRAIVLILVLSVAMVNAIDYYERSLVKMAAVTSENCFTKPAELLHLDYLPLPFGEKLSYLDLGSKLALTSNMTSFRLAATLALQQAFLHSMLHQVQNKSMDYQYQPGILYRYNSLDSYVTSTSDDVISAGLFYDKNLTYPNWWRTVAFNKTLGLFGLRSTRGEPSTAGSGTSLGGAYTADCGLDCSGLMEEDESQPQDQRAPVRSERKQQLAEEGK